MSFGLFYLLSGLCLILSLAVITASNPIHSVLGLVLLFLSGGLLLLLLGVDFLPLVFVVVYVGAVAVLFLFVVMMLNIKLEVQAKFSWLPWVFLMGGVLVFGPSVSLEPVSGFLWLGEVDQAWLGPFLHLDIWSRNVDLHTNVQVLGNVLYTHHMIHFLLGGLLLLVAIIGAIVLTASKFRKPIHQQLYRQTSRIPGVSWARKAW